MLGYMKSNDEMKLVRKRPTRLHNEEKRCSAKSIFQFLKPKEALPTKVIPAASFDDNEPWKKWMFDPGSAVMIKWNHVFLTTGLIALFIDPLYFYLSSIENGDQISCVRKIDRGLKDAVTICRSIADTFYFLHIFFKFRTAFIAPNSRVFGRGELVMNPKLIAKRYLKTEFLIDLASALPLPQVVVWFVIPGARHLNPQENNNTMALIVLIQYIPRLYVIFPMSQQIIKTTGVVTKTAWAGAVYNLLLYMIASNVIGAAYYLLSIDRQTTCWKSECWLENGTSGAPCQMNYLDCDFTSDVDPTWANNTSVFANCNASNNSISFSFGIYQNALTTGAGSTSFFRKYFYSLWWGLQNLSTFGQGLTSSTYVWETLFCVLIALLGLVLFAHLIGNIETYLQSVTIKLEEWRLRQRDTEQWMRHRQLPQELQDRVKRFARYKWFVTRGVDEESLLQVLPEDLRRDIQRYLCLGLVRRVPFFSQMDDPLLDAICERLVLSLNTEGSYIVREGDPVTEMLFVIHGKLESSTTNGGQAGFFNSITLRVGDFCGEELLSWALHPTTNLPSSTRTVRALVEVEAFALTAEDLNFVASQFRKLHSKKLRHTFRFYSQHWRTWAACFIQAWWRRYKRKKSRSLSLSESFSSHESKEEEVGGSPSNSPHLEQNIGAMMLPSEFSTSTRKGAQRKNVFDLSKLRKPDEPDFSTADYD